MSTSQTARSNTPEGAQGSTVMYSLIETAKENGLDPYRYLVYLLKTAPNLDQTTKNWVENVPDSCTVAKKEAKSDEKASH